MHSVALTQNNHDNLQEATRAAFKRACMCLANAGDHFEQKAAYSTSPLHVKYDHIARNCVLFVYGLRRYNSLHSE
jgi:hypothetical protein